MITITIPIKAIMMTAVISTLLLLNDILAAVLVGTAVIDGDGITVLVGALVSVKGIDVCLIG
jgi:hypothetical protein